MKTFEERYTAWIDGQLAGAELAAFEQELARRGADGDAEADRADCGRLRQLLQTQLRAPELSNQDFFSLQVRQRIDAEKPPQRAAAAPADRPAFTGLFPWPGSRMFGAGLACLGLAAVLFLMIIPQQSGPVGTTSHLAQAAPAAAAAPAPAVGGDQQNPPPGNDLMARNDVPADLTVTVPDDAAASTTATPLHYQQPNVNVLWVDGLDYIPSVPGADDGDNSNNKTPAAAAGSAAATVAP